MQISLSTFRNNCIVILVSILIASASNRVMAQNFYIGGYGDGIYSSTLAPSGEMSQPKLAVKQSNPSFLAFHPKLDILYAVTESNRNDLNSPAMVTAYRFGKADFGSPKAPILSYVNSQRIDGDAPCYVSLDTTGEFLAVANYTSGSVVLYPIALDGAIQAASCVMEHSELLSSEQSGLKPHAHCCVWKTNSCLFVADLGLDKVFVYDLDRKSGKLTLASQMPLEQGSGPRHLSIHPNGEWVYVINERKMTITLAIWQASKLRELQTVSTLPANPQGSNFSTAEVIVHPSGKFVYGSNRGHHTIASFRVDQLTGKLTSIGHTSTSGKTPRNFRISPNGEFMLVENQQSDTIFSFRIDAESGELTPTGFSINAPAPACIKFLER